MSKFKVGDKVKLNKQSKWANSGFNNPTDKVGVITSIDVGTLPIHVDWDKHSYNSYAEEDLIKENDMEVTRGNLNKHTIYVVTKTQWGFEAGEEVRLSYDDLSDCPKFKSLETGNEAFVSIMDIAILGDEPKITELTLEEIADKFDIEVENLRIKE